LTHEKLFLKLFNEFKKLTEERLIKLELNLNKKKHRSEVKEEIELESDLESIDNSSIDSKIKPSSKKQKLVTSPKYLRKKNKDKSDPINKIEREEICSINSEINKEFQENEIVRKFSKKNKFKTSDEESIMNVTEFSRGIKIMGNRVINKGTTVKHRFAFMSSYLNENSLKWTVEIVNIKEWVGLGVCLKDEIISSGYKFEKPLLHSTFLITSNGYIWNCRNQLENGSQIKNLCLKDKDIVKFKYILNERTLIAKYNGNKIQLTNIYSPKLNFLVPCVILLHENDQVEFNVIN
jgi:hypothetical protein